ncbi:hypothetical protein D910_01086, partial [Dendroctonus ponderosae]
MSDSEVQIDGRFIDLTDDAWRYDKLPDEDIEVPLHELADPEADSGDVHLTLKEQEQKWGDIMLSALRLGERCTVNECLQLDFLPLRCQCGKVFCSQHLQSHSQTCSKSRMLTEDELKCFDNVLVCSQDGCKDHSIVPMICPRCAKHFCIKHRHLTTCQDKTQEELQLEKDKFLQPARQFEQAKTLVDQQIQRRLAEGRKKPKSKELADKVQLMKIKNKATGLKTIPVLDKVYFNIHVPGKVVPVFVSKNWSL